MLFRSGQSFFDRAEIKDLCAWFRLWVNNNDDPAFLRAVGTPKRGIGHQTLAQLGAFATQYKLSLFESLFSHSLAAAVDGQAFILKWAADSSSSTKGTFPLDPNDLTTGVCEDHRKSFEIKITSAGKTLYFCCESADAQNTLLARIDAGRRLQVASVEIGPSGVAFYKTENAVISAGNGLMLGEPGKKVFSWGVGTLLGIGAPNISGMAVPQRIPAFRER